MDYGASQDIYGNKIYSMTGDGANAEGATIMILAKSTAIDDAAISTGGRTGDAWVYFGENWPGCRGRGPGFCYIATEQ